MKTKMRTIDIIALEWMDRINGNSYFAARLIINLQMKGEQTILLPFQYGYGDHYQDMAKQELKARGLLPNGINHLWQLSELGVIIRSSKMENCKKRDLKQLTK